MVEKIKVVNTIINTTIEQINNLIEFRQAVYQTACKGRHPERCGQKPDKIGQSAASAVSERATPDTQACAPVA
jgi:hypothetical protein